MKGRYLDDAQRRWVSNWWNALQPQISGGKDASKDALQDASKDTGQADTRFAAHALSGLGRGARAELKRCAGIQELMLNSATHKLAFGLLKSEAGKAHPRFKDDYAAVALVAGALAHVRDDAKDARSLAAVVGGGDPAMSELRFLRLLRTTVEDDFYRQLTRALQLAKRKADVVVLAEDILAWIIERYQPQSDPNYRLHSRWARDYYLPALERAAYENSTEIQQ